MLDIHGYICSLVYPKFMFVRNNLQLLCEQARFGHSRHSHVDRTIRITNNSDSLHLRSIHYLKCFTLTDFFEYHAESYERKVWTSPMLQINLKIINYTKAIPISEDKSNATIFARDRSCQLNHASGSFYVSILTATEQGLNLAKLCPQITIEYMQIL